jgi:hypothetical protein
MCFHKTIGEIMKARRLEGERKMRRAQQQEILESVNTLHEAHAEIKGSIEKRQNHIAQGILAECQECAISIGNLIEAFEGEGFITISFFNSEI